MYTKNLMVKDLFMTFANTEIKMLLRKGFMEQNALLIYTTLEDLLRRGLVDDILVELRIAAEEGDFITGTPIAIAVGNILKTSNRQSLLLKKISEKTEDAPGIHTPQWVTHIIDNHMRGPKDDSFEKMLGDLHMEQVELH